MLLQLCVASVLAQSYEHFELVILENKSTDGGGPWLQNLAQRDSRIKFIPSEESLSIEENWKRILAIPKNEFMTIIGHDDLLEPDFLDEINKTILEQPSANLYLTHFKLIDSDGKLIRYCTPMPKFETASDFLATRMAGIRDSFGTGYVMRSECYDRVGGIPAYPKLLFADDALWLALIGSGIKVTSNKVCFSYRLHAGSTSGNPDNSSLFHGLKKYLHFLSDLSKERDELACVIKLYGPKYVLKWCQAYYCSVLRSTPWGREIDSNILFEIKDVLLRYAGEFKLNEKCTACGKKSYLKYLVTSAVKRISGAL